MKERTLTDASEERPHVDPRRLREIRPRDLVVRFAFGAATSVVSALVTFQFSARAGGVLLAFPAILAASVTLIAHNEGASAAREDARGAVLGGIGLACFAAVGALLFGRLPGAAVLAIAGAAWMLAALGTYRLLWQRA
jgi:hypothetical protein